MPTPDYFRFFFFFRFTFDTANDLSLMSVPLSVAMEMYVHGFYGNRFSISMATQVTDSAGQSTRKMMLFDFDFRFHSYVICWSCRLCTYDNIDEKIFFDIFYEIFLYFG